jgi:hypothetical protein
MAGTTIDQMDVEPEEPSGIEPSETVKPKSGRRSFSKLPRELSEKELASPAVQKMLVDEIERLEAECDDFSSYRPKFHDADKRAAILEEKFKGKISVDILQTGCLTVGAAALGYAPSITTGQLSSWMVAVFGVVLVVAGLAAKAVKP